MSIDLRKLLALFFLMIALFLLLIMFAGCNPQRKIDKAKLRLDSSGQAAAYCALRFPVKDSIIIRDSVHFDTLYQGETFFDTVTVIKSDTVFKTIVKTLPAQVITKTQVVTKEVWRENTAKYEALKTEYDKCKAEGGKLRQESAQKSAKITQIKNQRSTAYLLCLLLLVVLFRKPLFKLIRLWIGG